MPDYTLPHALRGERERLGILSQALDPTHRRHLEELGLQPGWKCMEVACGNGTISEWMAVRVAPGGRVLATDVDIQYLNDIRLPNLEVRRLNILEDPLEQNAYDVVTARAVLHHLPDNALAVERMVSALKPGGVFLSIEPDMLPATAAEPESMRKFWQGWLKWSVSVGIDYSIGRKMPALLVSKGLEDVGAQGYAEFFNGGSLWANMWLETIEELQQRLLDSGSISQELLDDFYNRYDDPSYWTTVINFVASWGRKRKSNA